MEYNKLPQMIISDGISKSEYIKSIFGHLPLLDVKMGKDVIDVVPYNDNLSELYNEPDEANQNPIGYIESLGLDRTCYGEMVLISVCGNYPSANIISDEEAVRLIIKHEKYELLNRFHLQEKAKDLIADKKT